MIELLNISIGYEHRELLTRVNARLDNCKLNALIGRNGSGKSTLLRTIAGIATPADGIVKIDGQEFKRSERPKLARHLSFVNTERVRISNMKCRDIVALGRMPYTNWIGNLSNKDRDMIDKAMTMVGMRHLADRAFDSLSDGECQRIMIARAIAQETPNILLDEPTSFLDIPNRCELATLLRSLAHDHGKCIFFSTHELDLALDTCDNIILIDNPRLICNTPTEIVTQGYLNKLFNIPAH